jgi:hypothetical protein
MRKSELQAAASPEAIAQHVAEQRSELARHDHGHGPTMESVREATHRGHHIVIRTTYHVEVDGRPVEGHVGVTNDGRVHYHALPNIDFASAVDLAKRLIDAFPEDFERGPEPHPHG